MTVRILLDGSEPHRCDLPVLASPDTVVECAECGRRWWCAYTDEMYPMSTVIVSHWTPLRWWNWRLRRAANTSNTGGSDR